MIQAINSVNTNSYKKQNTSFKQQEVQSDIGAIYKPPSKTKRILGFAGREFLAGALISTVMDLVYNGYSLVKNKILKNKMIKSPECQNALAEKMNKLIGSKKILTNAAVFGAFMLLVSAVFVGIDVIRNKNKKTNPVV